MKKAGVITHYDVHNHGAHLQLYALVQCLKAQGYDAKALRFKKNYDFLGGSEAEKKYNISIRSIPTYIKYLFSKGISRTLFNIKKRKTLEIFRSREDLVGEYYSEAKDLDIVVIGSDEIFSVEAGPNPWYYGIGISCKNQISYAASFGPTTLHSIEDHNVGGLIEAGLRNLKSISVRDGNSAMIVEHYIGEKPEVVCDPVLLYGFPEQLGLESFRAFQKQHTEKYCIVYSYDSNMNDEQTVKAIKGFARKRGLKIYSIGYYHKWCDKSINLDPLDVFKWFLGAEIVFTDTFHGTVISLETEAQFVVLIRENGNKLAFLLEQYGVTERRVNVFSEIENVVETPIDYKIVGQRIIDIREESIQYLKKAVH